MLEIALVALSPLFKVLDPPLNSPKIYPYKMYIGRLADNWLSIVMVNNKLRFAKIYLLLEGIGEESIFLLFHRLPKAFLQLFLLS